MIYTNTVDSFTLRSDWTCKGVETDGMWRWFIVEGPSTDGRNATFSVSLPADAVISRVWISVTLSSPLSGSAVQTVNDLKIPSSGEVDIEGVNAQTTEYAARFAFKANGRIYEDTNSHYATLQFNSPTLNVEYYSESENAPEPDEDDPGNIDREDGNGRYMPRLLDENLVEVARLEPTKVSLDLQLQPLSTATVTLPAGQETVKVRSFMELFAPDGSAGIFRVMEVENVYGYDGISQRLHLEHAYTTLADDLTIGVQAMSGTYNTVIGTLLDSQTTKRWMLGDVDIPSDYEVVYSHKYESILQAVQGLIDMAPEEYALEFDTLHFPWTMHIRKYGDEEACECRMNRNIEGVTINIDTSSLCTRLYPFGTGEGTDRINLATLTGALYMDSDTRDTWGTVAKTFTNEEIFDSITLEDVAKRYLERYKNPTVSVSVSAIAMYTMTGEPLDRFKLGRVCNLPLVDYGTIMRERVVAIYYPDVYNRPHQATLTLANKLRTVTDDLAELIRVSTASKLIGGTVQSTELKSSAGDIASDDPMVHNFEITSYGNLLAAKVRYTTSPSTTCRVRVDGTTIDGAPSMAQPIDILRYLSTDESGVPTVGSHYVELSPVAASSSETFWVHSTVILKTIEKN